MAKTVIVECSSRVPGSRHGNRTCGWQGRRVDGRRVQAPCPICGGRPDVFRRERPTDRVREVFYKSKSPFSDREPSRAVICGSWAKNMLSIETADGTGLVVLSEELTLVDPPKGGPTDVR